MNYGGVCRTAPATPGLVKIVLYSIGITVAGEMTYLRVLNYVPLTINVSTFLGTSKCKFYLEVCLLCLPEKLVFFAASQRAKSEVSFV